MNALKELKISELLERLLAESASVTQMVHGEINSGENFTRYQDRILNIYSEIKRKTDTVGDNEPAPFLNPQDVRKNPDRAA